MIVSQSKKCLRKDLAFWWTFFLSWSWYPPPKHIMKEDTIEFYPPITYKPPALSPLSHSISSSVIITSCNIIPTQLNLLTLEHEKPPTVFVFPLDLRCTGAWISWLETDQCVSSALRWKHFEALWSFGKHTRVYMHKHKVALSMFISTAKKEEEHP